MLSQFALCNLEVIAERRFDVVDVLQRVPVERRLGHQIDKGNVGRRNISSLRLQGVQHNLEKFPVAIRSDRAVRVSGGAVHVVLEDCGFSVLLLFKLLRALFRRESIIESRE